MGLLIIPALIVIAMGLFLYNIDSQINKKIELQKQHRLEMDARLEVMKQDPLFYIEFEANQNLYRTKSFEPCILSYNREIFRTSEQVATRKLLDYMEKGCIININNEHFPTCNITAARVKAEQKQEFETSGA